MPTLAPAVSSTIQPTAAQREAANNWNRNLDALRRNQPAIADELQQIQLDVQWLFARDGSLTAMNPDGKWWGDCSVPLLAGRSILASLDHGAIGSCLLDPPHAGLVRAARQRMGACPVLFVVQPNPRIARMILCCHDFSEQIGMHRFWILCGQDWSAAFAGIFDTYPGLATPTRFIRTKWSADEIITSLITEAQNVLSAVLNARVEELSNRKSALGWAENRANILVIGQSEFRLWDNAAGVLREQLSGLSGTRQLSLHDFDTDDALNGSPLALLAAASECGSVVSANLCRADCNQLIPTDMPWITWITLPAVPAFASAGPKDSLVLADPNWQTIANKAGWPADRVKICGWPIRPQTQPNSPGNGLALICDTRAIEIPATVKNFSSHRLLWELIEEELQTDPLAVEKVDDYLADRAGQLHIGVDALDRRSFIEGLILPAYQQGLARLLIAELCLKTEPGRAAPVLPGPTRPGSDLHILRLYGRGWDELNEFTPHSYGVISSEEELQTALATSAALIYCWPDRSAHPIESTGKPIVYRSGRDRNQLLRNARAAMQWIKPTITQAHLTLGECVMNLLHVGE